MRRLSKDVFAAAFLFCLSRYFQVEFCKARGFSRPSFHVPPTAEGACTAVLPSHSPEQPRVSFIPELASLDRGKCSRKQMYCRHRRASTAKAPPSTFEKKEIYWNTDSRLSAVKKSTNRRAESNLAGNPLRRREVGTADVPLLSGGPKPAVKWRVCVRVSGLRVWGPVYGVKAPGTDSVRELYVSTTSDRLSGSSSPAAFRSPCSPSSPEKTMFFMS